MRHTSSPPGPARRHSTPGRRPRQPGIQSLLRLAWLVPSLGLVLLLAFPPRDVATQAARIITTVAGTGTAGFGGDGLPAASAPLNRPHGVAVDPAGNGFIADSENHRIRRVDAATGLIATIAGTGRAGLVGDGGPAASAELNFPAGLAFDPSGNLYIAEPGNDRVRRIDAETGLIATVAGGGTAGLGDGTPATIAQLNAPLGVAVDSSGNLYIADAGNHRIRKVSADTGLITTVAGVGSEGFAGDGGPAASAQLNRPVAVALDAAGNLLIADSENHRIRRVDAAAGTITTIAGGGTAGLGDGAPATVAQIGFPSGLALDGAGNLFITDTGGQRIRKVLAGTGIITTVAGTGNPGFDGDGGPATSAALNEPLGIALDALGNLFIADRDNHRIRRVQGVGTFPPGILSPPNAATLSTTSLTTFSWTPVPGAQAYLFEYTGPNSTFSNPRGSIPDPINGVPPRGASFGVGTTGFSVVLAPAPPPGTYQFRIAALDASGRLLGTFGEARTVVIPPPAPTPPPTPTPVPTPGVGGGGGEGGGT